VKEPQYRIENGRKVYSMECRIDAERRPVGADPRACPQEDAPVGAHLQDDVATENEEEPGSRVKPGMTGTEGADRGVCQEKGGHSDAPLQNAVGDDLVRVRYRLLSAVNAWPSMGWLGPQLVAYGHNDGAALKQLPDLINGRPRPVPLMWNHSYDMKDKAGRVENAEWEDSDDIPVGVNGELVVDRRYDPKAALGLETGEIDATSISVVFDMEASHPDMDFDRFIQHQGREVDGRLVQWLPLNAKEVLHHAMVWSGADPNSGPRPFVSRNTAEAVTNTLAEGGVTMTNTALEILASLSESLGVEVTLSEGAPPPDDLQQRLATKVDWLKAENARLSEELKTALPVVNQRAAELEALAPFVRLGEETLSSDEIMGRLPGRLALAQQGERYVADLRNGALALFDAAKVQPDREQSMEERAIRSLIEQCSDIDQLKAWSMEYGKQAQARYGATEAMRSSRGEDVPDDTVKQTERFGRDRDIAESVRRMFGRRSEG